MIRVNEIAFTGYPVTDVARARAFYEGVLGLAVETDFSNDNHTWIEYNIGGATLAISNSWPPTHVPGGPGVGLEVEDFDAAVATLREAHVPMEGPHEFPSCHMLLIRDPDGNGMVIHKRKPGHDG